MDDARVSGFSVPAAASAAPAPYPRTNPGIPRKPSLVTLVQTATPPAAASNDIARRSSLGVPTEARPENMPGRVARKVDAPHFAKNVVLAKKPPITAIQRIVSVVSQHEVVAGRNYNWPPVVARRVVMDCVAAGGANQEGALPEKIIRNGIDVRLLVPCIWLTRLTTVDEQDPVSHGKCVAGQADDALDEFLRPIRRPYVSDQLPTTRHTDRTLRDGEPIAGE